MKAPCYQHDSYDSNCSSCRELNGLGQNKLRAEVGVNTRDGVNAKQSTEGGGLSLSDLECLSSWLRCNPVPARESERKRLTKVVEVEMKYRQQNPPKGDGKQVTQQQEDDLGEDIERLDNLAHALLIPMPADFHVRQLKESLPKVVAEFKKHYAASFGWNPWEGHPE